MAEQELAAEAYNATKVEGDPAFEATPIQYQNELRERADAVVRTGVTINNFEEKVKEIHGKRKSENPGTPLGTKNHLDDMPESEAIKTFKATYAKKA